MEKTVQITIGATLFQLTQAAYDELASYLASLRSHFAEETGHDEILHDIESRIAEKLLEKKQDVITKKDVTSVLSEMGSASEMDEEAAPHDTETLPRGTYKKLYRDTQDARIAGVASGIAKYFDIEIFWLRIIFLISILFGGTGIFLYIVLWILVPEAKTSSQKLEMRGDPVNLEGIARVVKESVGEARKHSAMRKFLESVRRVVHRIFRILGKVIGTAFILGAFFGAIGLLIGTGIIITNWNAPYNDFPLYGVVSNTLLMGGLAAIFVVALIPLVFIFALGIRLFSKKILLQGATAISLIGVWAIAISAAGTIGVKLAGEFFEYQRTSPDYQPQTRTLDLPAFTKVSTHEERVTIKHGDTQQVILEGRALTMDNVQIEVKDGTLRISEKDDYGKLCIFCDDSSPDITITTPDLDAVFIESGTAWFDAYTDPQLSIEMFYGAMRGKLDVPQLSIKADGGTLRATINTEALTMNIEDGHLDIDGSAKDAKIHLTETSFYGNLFSIENATLNTSRSTVELNAVNTEKNDDPTSRVTIRKIE
ncbi:MAG: PspC domain-containing protein [Patescibacteria group bacterium]